MVGAIAVASIGFRLVLRRGQPLFGERFHLPTARHVDTRIVVGPAMFGIGWGLAGFCPGPALTALFTGGAPLPGCSSQPCFAGMAGARWLAERQGPRSRSGPPPERLIPHASGGAP